MRALQTSRQLRFDPRPREGATLAVLAHRRALWLRFDPRPREGATPLPNWTLASGAQFRSAPP